MTVQLLLDQATDRIVVTRFRRLCAELMLDLLACKCGGGERRSNARLANRRANLLDVVEVGCLAHDLCDIVMEATGVNRELAAGVVSAYLDEARLGAYQTLRWRAWRALACAEYRRAFLGATARAVAA